MAERNGARVTRARARSELQKALDELQNAEDGAVICRANGHWWKPSHAEEIPEGWYTIQKCNNCKSWRHQWVSHTGELIVSRLQYGEHFHMFKGLGHNTGIRKGAARLESIRRIK